MVDRITPATGPRERAIAAEFGMGDDPVPVTCEPFRQWVLEDTFPAGRPAWEKVGATFTAHVHAFETMKIRILNGGHALIAYPAGIKGIHFVHEAMADPLIYAFVDAVVSREILPIVPPVPEQDLLAYKSMILHRFSNPDVADTVRRLCLDGSNRQPKFIVPSIRDALVAGHKAEGLTLLSALWCRYCYGVTEASEQIAPNDPNWDRLQTRAAQARTSPSVWIAMRQVYGDLAQNAEFMGQFAEALDYVWAHGVDAALKRYVEKMSI
jgi:mannitol 2-dehydrogenase